MCRRAMRLLLHANSSFAGLNAVPLDDRGWGWGDAGGGSAGAEGAEGGAAAFAGGGGVGGGPTGGGPPVAMSAAELASLALVDEEGAQVRI